MIKHSLKIILAVWLLIIVQGCKKFLDIVPDNIPVLDHAFATRVTAEKYLITCYAGLPQMGNPAYNPAYLSGEEFWTWGIITFPDRQEFIPFFRIAKGEQNTDAPLVNTYEGDLFKNIRRCNIFLENIDKVYELTQEEKDRWKSEAKVIKAYCMFYLMRMYGPIPIMKENLPVFAEPEEVRVKRTPFDEGIEYLVSIIEEALPNLMPLIEKPQEELGRITKPVALAIKADILTIAASPQFNGNPYYATWKNKDGQLLFKAKDEAKWGIAAEACKEAIDAAHATGARLYREYNPLGNLSPAEVKEYTVRGAVTNELWSEELIWGEVNTNTNGLQSLAMPYLDGRMNIGGHMHLLLGVNMKVANEFYTKNGVPIEEDKDWTGKNLTALRTANTVENSVIKGKTAEVNFDRESRFYGSVGFDRGVWYGNGNGNGQSGLNPWIVLGLKTQAANTNGTGERTNITGYWAKKLINRNTTMASTSSFSAKRYPFPIYRLVDLYLMYAETLNEASGPTAEVYTYIDSVRSRAGLSGVVQSWSQYSVNPGKPGTKDGLRQIIQRERMIELAFEGKRFWDLRRWLRLESEMNKPVTGWNVDGTTPDVYYQVRSLAYPGYNLRDYLWPIRQFMLTVNPNMVQAPGW